MVTIGSRTVSPPSLSLGDGSPGPELGDQGSYPGRSHRQREGCARGPMTVFSCLLEPDLPQQRCGHRPCKSSSHRPVPKSNEEENFMSQSMGRNVPHAPVSVRRFNQPWISRKVPPKVSFGHFES